MYTFRELLRDLDSDFQRYENKVHIYSKKRFLQRIGVLVRSPAFLPIIIYRFGFWLDRKSYNRRNPLRGLLKIIYYAAKYFVIVATKISISQSSIIGAGLYISNRGNCIIGVQTMGSNCSIGHSTTVGMGRENVPPTIGNNVVIGSMSVIYGKIIIGNDVIIENNTVIAKSVPDGVRVRGNPGKIIL